MGKGGVEDTYYENFSQIKKRNCKNKQMALKESCFKEAGG